MELQSKQRFFVLCRSATWGLDSAAQAWKTCLGFSSSRNCKKNRFIEWPIRAALNNKLIWPMWPRERLHQCINQTLRSTEPGTKKTGGSPRPEIFRKFSKKIHIFLFFLGTPFQVHVPVQVRGLRLPASQRIFPWQFWGVKPPRSKQIDPEKVEKSSKKLLMILYTVTLF